MCQKCLVHDPGAIENFLAGTTMDPTELGRATPRMVGEFGTPKHSQYSNCTVHMCGLVEPQATHLRRLCEEVDDFCWGSG